MSDTTVTRPIVCACEHCEDGIRWTSRFGGNDPDVSPSHCDDCDGTGERIVMCDACPDTLATEFHDGQWWCDVCWKDAMS